MLDNCEISLRASADDHVGNQSETVLSFWFPFLQFFFSLFFAGKASLHGW